MASDQRPENAVVTDVHRQMADDFCTREVLYYDGNPEPVAQLIANVERATVERCAEKAEQIACSDLCRSEDVRRAASVGGG